MKFLTRKIRETLLQFNTSVPKDPDGIPAFVPVPLNLLTFSTNFSAFIHNSVFLGTCSRLPYPQEGDKSYPSNYQPFAITSFIVMEIITKQLIAFLETCNLLSDHQYVFRQARSTDGLVYAGKCGKFNASEQNED